ncbi:MAG: hypothetical protein O2954_12030 [bacterium]|nr:hypothetical protein [bacterium]
MNGNSVYRKSALHLFLRKSERPFTRYFGWYVVFILLLALAAPVAAQNVSVTDYVVPVSRADNLRIDALSLNYVTEGDETVVQTGNLTVVYKKFYESLPFAYSIDMTGITSFNRDNIKDKMMGNLTANLKTNVKKYRRQDGALFYSWGTDSNFDESFDRPGVDMTVGIGYGRFINATALRKAVRIEDFFLEEGIVAEHLPKETMIELGHIIEKEKEYKELYGDRYQNYWFEDMLGEIQKSGLVLGDISFGLLRMQEVLFRERISDRFYGWDVTAGVQFEVLTPFEGRARRAPGLSIGVRYSRPLNWSTQINTALIADTPFSGNFGRVYNVRQNTDFIYEITNKINFTMLHTFRVNKSKEKDAQLSTTISFAFNFFIENKINLSLAEALTTIEGSPFRQSFNVGLSYKLF